MGNYVSCTLGAPGGRRSRSAKVIFPGGEFREFFASTKAAEIMLENPSFFLANLQSLHVGRRFSALSADEDLEAANIYVMFPMKRLNSLVMAADMGPLFLAASRGALGGRVRILPEPGLVHAESAESPVRAVNRPGWSPKLNLEGIEGYSDSEIRHRLSMSRSKKPLLETIAEEPASPRRIRRYITTNSLAL
ncbi:hypothetical protein SAY86_007770 [Trapa natans]|uniref:Uncharacterized protein n=1 Tax=Trapa natans TaxID=22666 RepID=A0AAN7LMB8_TRANT|nr:hypothetical protein SAY86_007770 [Trapa natans]